MRSRVYETVGVRPSVCLTSCAAGLLLWAPRAGDIDPQQHGALSSKCEQCRVYSDVGSWTPLTFIGVSLARQLGSSPSNSFVVSLVRLMSPRDILVSKSFFLFIR